MKQLIFVLLFSFSGFGQVYDPIPDSASVWQIDRLSWGQFYPMIDFVASSDTTINSNTYRQILKGSDTSNFDPFPSNFIGGIRGEDSIWYAIKSGDSTEHLLYDFSLLAGDTITIYNPWVFQSTTLEVLSIDSILIQGQYRKRLNLDNAINPGWPESWIEGIGSTFGIIYSGENLWDEGHMLMCFHSNDTLLYIEPNYNDCNYSTVKLFELNHGYHEVVVIVDIMGRETEDKPNTLLIYIYSNGTTEKVFRVE